MQVTRLNASIGCVGQRSEDMGGRPRLLSSSMTGNFGGNLRGGKRENYSLSSFMYENNNALAF